MMKLEKNEAEHPSEKEKEEERKEGEEIKHDSGKQSSKNTQGIACPRTFVQF